MNNKHLYCTLAVGERYLKSALKMVETLNKVSNDHHFLIVTHAEIPDVPPNTTIEILPEDKVLFLGECFNYMLKYYPLYMASKTNYENIIFIDADWRIRKEYNAKRVNELFEHMDKENLDILFERPCNIGDGKKNSQECIFYHKIDFYKLLETDEYDAGYFCNEQFLVFKNNDKFKVFVEKFKELYYHGTKHELWPFAEGLEMGMSMAVAKLKGAWMHWGFFLREFFEFTSNDGGVSVKFW